MARHRTASGTATLLLGPRRTVRQADAERTLESPRGAPLRIRPRRLELSRRSVRCPAARRLRSGICHNPGHSAQWWRYSFDSSIGPAPDDELPGEASSVFIIMLGSPRPISPERTRVSLSGSSLRLRWRAPTKPPARPPELRTARHWRP